MPGYEVIGVFNAGVARVAEQVVLLLRVAERPVGLSSDVAAAPVYEPDQDAVAVREFSRGDPENDFSDLRLINTPGGTYLTSISHLRIARSRDGVHFEVDRQAAMSACNAYEAFGIEDSRISEIGGVYYITYVAVSPWGVVTCLASTSDFAVFERHGVIFCPDNKDVVLLPERVGDRYWALHRPASSLFARQDMWIAESPDLLCWGDHRRLIGTRENHWDGLKIGAGAPPFAVDAGWLEIYHGADANNRYCLGAVLMDRERPWVVKARSSRPIFEPEADYERQGFFGEVVFTCGCLFEDGCVKVYYGAADTSICCAELPIEHVLGTLES